MFSETLMIQARELLQQCRAQRLRLAAAESCTGGLLAALLTEIPGSSDVFERGFVTYSNATKTELLGVPAALVATHGAVSEQVARAMAEGALKHSHADIAVAITGIAGPDGGSAEKQVGLVHIACAARDKKEIAHEKHLFSGARRQVRLSAVEKALAMLRRAL